MKVVTNPLEMRRALDELAGLDLVLIDTAGRSPKDDLQIQELKSLLAEAHVDEVHLVLSLTTSLRGLEASAAKFAAAGTTAMILTKLDEASGMGRCSPSPVASTCRSATSRRGRPCRTTSSRPIRAGSRGSSSERKGPRNDESRTASSWGPGARSARSRCNGCNRTARTPSRRLNGSRAQSP